jgi:undecaprenyl diphosphate synthase
MTVKAPTSPGVPGHLAIIMDGNGRWAAARGRPRQLGHRAGIKAARAIVEATLNAGVRTLTLFAFSSENWKRPRTEVDALMQLFAEVLQREVKVLHENGIQLRFVGARETLSPVLRRHMAEAELRTAGNQRMTLVLAVAYGGRWDMVQTVRRIAQKVRSGEIDPADIDEQLLERHRALAGLPAPDLLVRTGGEHRISNFLLWDLAYSELYFTGTLWPDFSPGELAQALEFFAQRERRFGRTSDQLEAVAD